MTAPRPAYADIADRIEHEMRALGAWSPSAPSPDQIRDGGAFGIATMPFTQWLQFVLLPRLGEVARGVTEPPAESHVHAQAVREFDGWHESEPLQDALLALDRLVEDGA